MWFESMAPAPHSDWFFTFLERLLQGDRDTLKLLRTNPFPNAPPRYIRAQYYRYTFTTPDEHRKNGLWWNRQRIGTFYGPVFSPASSAPKRANARGPSLDSFSFLLVAELKGEAVLLLLTLERLHFLLMLLLELGSLRRPGRLAQLLLVLRLQDSSLLEVARVEVGTFLRMPRVERRPLLRTAGGKVG